MTLELILVKMQKAAVNGDQEEAHVDADDLLIAALRQVAPKDKTVKAIIEAYHQVGKWYA